MKRINLLLPALILLAVACKHQPNQPAGPDQPTEDSVSAGSYLPVADFIKNDIVRVDSFSGGILRKATTNGKKDSAFIKLPTFHQLASIFLLPELDSASFHDHFKEHSLMDETTAMLNFIYTPTSADGSLHNVMVYLTPSSTGTDKVNRIYLERSFTSGDTAVQQKLTWKMEEYFYIITIRQPKDGPTVTSMEKVIWDPQHFAE